MAFINNLIEMFQVQTVYLNQRLEQKPKKIHTFSIQVIGIGT